MIEKVGIILATYNPPIEFFQKQIYSIQNQTWQNWICHIVDDFSAPESQADIKKIVGDDSRFICHFHDRNLKHYYNFERGLQYCAQDTTITAFSFCDQDDIWEADKLEISLKKLRSEQAVLVHSDLQLIDSQDQTIHLSTWDFEGRKPEAATIELLLLRNVVTGCSLLFCSSLLPKILPFPNQDDVGWHHDWWVALVAMQMGKIIHIRQPLIRYRLHNSNTVGAIQNAGKINNELFLWIAKKYRIRGKSYLIHSKLSQAFYQRFTEKLGSEWFDPFDDKRLDFGLGILQLLYKNWQRGYGAEGIAVRILIFKIMFDLQEIQKHLFKNLFQN